MTEVIGLSNMPEYEVVQSEPGAWVFLFRRKGTEEWHGPFTSQQDLNLAMARDRAKFESLNS